LLLLKKERKVWALLCPATQSGIIALPYTTVHGQFGKQHHTALPEAPEIRKRQFISLSLDLPLVAMACDVPEWSDFLGGHNQRRPIRWLSRAQGRDLQSVSRHVHNDRMAQCESVQDLHLFPVSPPRFQWTHVQTPIDTTLGLVRPPLIHLDKNLEGSRGRQSRPVPALHQVAQKPGIAPRAAHSVGHAPCCPWLVLTASVGAHTDTPSIPPQPTHHPSHMGCITPNLAAQQGSPVSVAGAQTAIEREWMFPCLLGVGLWASALQLALPRSRPHLALCTMPLDWQRQR
jgi:hypothetical protein